MYLWTYGLRKTLLDKCLRSPVSEDPLTSNILNGPKHCSNLNQSTFTIFIDSCETNSGWESLPGLYTKCSDCFLTHWLAITRILFLIETIYSNMFRCKYLKKKFFYNFFSQFWNLDSILNILKKRWLLQMTCFWTYRLRKTWWFKRLKGLV